jgi:agmatine deiminase
MPRKIVREGLRLPASYANFYIVNSCVLVPTFADPADEPALSTLGKVFPDRRVIGIDCRELIWGLGTFHCLTQQQPAI